MTILSRKHAFLVFFFFFLFNSQDFGQKHKDDYYVFGSRAFDD